jgi:hypothetical protein
MRSKDGQRIARMMNCFAAYKSLDSP